MAENPTTASYAKEKLGLGLITLLRSIAPIFLTQKPQEVLVNATARSMVTLIRTDTTRGIPFGTTIFQDKDG